MTHVGPSSKLGWHKLCMPTVRWPLSSESFFRLPRWFPLQPHLLQPYWDLRDSHLCSPCGRFNHRSVASKQWFQIYSEVSLNSGKLCNLVVRVKAVWDRNGNSLWYLVYEGMKPFIPPGRLTILHWKGIEWRSKSALCREFQNAIAVVGASGLGASYFLIHIYVTPLKRFLQSLFALGTAGGLYLMLTQVKICPFWILVDLTLLCKDQELILQLKRSLPLPFLSWQMCMPCTE